MPSWDVHLHGSCSKEFIAHAIRGSTFKPSSLRQRLGHIISKRLSWNVRKRQSLEDVFRKPFTKDLSPSHPHMHTHTNTHAHTHTRTHTQTHARVPLTLVPPSLRLAWALNGIAYLDRSCWHIVSENVIFRPYFPFTGVCPKGNDLLTTGRPVRWMRTARLQSDYLRYPNHLPYL